MPPATLSASLPLSATGTFSNDDVYPLVRLASASAGSVAGAVLGALALAEVSRRFPELR